MRGQILVAVGALVFKVIHLSTANPLHHTITGLATIEPVGATDISPPKLGAPVSKRDEWIANLGNGWASYVQTWESYIPVHLAASTLTNFYSLIVDRMQGGSQSLGNPDLFMAFEWNDLRLEFSSDAGTISWELIARFAAGMVARTQAGFTGQFNAVYVHMATEQSIRISLMVLQNIGIERTGQNF